MYTLNKAPNISQCNRQREYNSGVASWTSALGKYTAYFQSLTQLGKTRRLIQYIRYFYESAISPFSQCSFSSDQPFKCREYIYIYDPPRPLQHSRPKRIPRSYPSLKNIPFSRNLDNKPHPFFNRNRWFWSSIKHPFLSKTRFFRNISYSSRFVKVGICVTVSNSRHFSMYVAFFIVSKLWLKLKHIYK